MDPMATLKSFDEAKRGDDRENVALYADAMVGWLEKDGFLPWTLETPSDWRSSLTRRQLTAYFRDMRRVAEMA